MGRGLHKLKARCQHNACVSIISGTLDVQVTLPYLAYTSVPLSSWSQQGIHQGRGVGPVT